jgi:hypothetical protein
MDDTMEKVASKTSKRRQSTATYDSKPQAGDMELLGVNILLIGRVNVTGRSFVTD